MKTEFLQNIELEGGAKLPKDVINAIFAENGKDIEALKQKYSDYDDLKTQLKEANDTIKSYKDMDIDGIKQSVEDYKVKFETAQKESKAKIEQMQFSSALEVAIASSGAKNGKALKGLLDMEKIKFEDGKLTGYDEQLEAIKKDNDYLFSTSTGDPGSSGLPHGKGPADLSNLSDEEYYAQVLKK